MAVQLNKSLMNACLKHIRRLEQCQRQRRHGLNSEHGRALADLRGPHRRRRAHLKRHGFPDIAAGLRVPFDVLLFDKKLVILCSASTVLQQIKDGSPPVPVEIFVQAKAEEPRRSPLSGSRASIASRPWALKRSMCCWEHQASVLPTM
ncbi:hypothetical protein L210DRAFT_3182136 [Boletus edulis BED1]|uniref:Uncharacterized protein n=1 Tax=Boletus edulis BED1 TaxID=1328754 RepID=A0AAD4BGB1_BOLED|nr:hypothetical protein L210DRAFT_230838 [Boletus edulis BED1]KAF8426807.1 hypothetical protein L210DRAFT_3182136 [Boletus edulis BED1]